MNRFSLWYWQTEGTIKNTLEYMTINNRHAVLIFCIHSEAYSRGLQPSLTSVGMKSWLSMIQRTSEIKFVLWREGSQSGFEWLSWSPEPCFSFDVITVAVVITEDMMSFAQMTAAHIFTFKQTWMEYEKKEPKDLVHYLMWLNPKICFDMASTSWRKAPVLRFLNWPWPQQHYTWTCQHQY